VEIVIIACYVLPLAFIFVYSLVQLHLALDFWWRRHKARKNFLPMQDDFVPFVTIQLPVYNELYVVERLLDAIVKMDYPKDKVEIQVLDDSTDETSKIIAEKIKELAHYGWDMQHIQRDNREGFKAGALAYGLTFCKGEFIAIFDADFIPHSDFLNRTIPFFREEKIGVVQTRWEHMNKDFSFFTQMQAFALDAHFVVEQMGRNLAGHFINFNGTAGLWRKSCIEDAGGWASDTLTEDLDLSYRAQLKGWEFKYLVDVVTPAELPVAMPAFKSQQFRWTKGAAECAVKNLPRVMKAKNVKFIDKLHAVFHLMNSGIFICILSLSISSVPLVYIQHTATGTSAYSHILEYAAMGSLNMIMVFIFFFLSYEHTRGFSAKTFSTFIVKFPFFLCLSMGMALHNALAALEGYRGKKSPFVRTPKFNIEGKKQNKNKAVAKPNWAANKYMKKGIKPMVILEACLALFYLAAIVLSVMNGIYGMLPFHIMLFTGYAMITGYSFTHARMLSEMSS
jgi:cellulose synthase/poly-beta-1,6-N-acetylglucosamine synthase-like glycosyltransferase